ncbi:conserved hypothetical protein [uncultured Eubacteriales bacterium]|uniref:Uncharacterized protein n=1 Tax=uncultured Eubacteriales bacterium TaxID=172733 RepID=A0A212K6X7_9FIRM|nr:conserved hypothetical protein [uncultured Eubacteriales bacterium]
MKDKQPRGDIYEVKKAPEKNAAKKKPNIVVRLLAFLLTLALVLGAVALVVYRDKVSFDSLRRYFAYHNLQKNDSGQAESFHYDGSSKDSFAAAGDSLLVCSDSGVRLYSGSGAQYAADQAVLESPVTQSSGSYALAYDAGGRSLFVYKDRSEKGTPPQENIQGDILSARVNASGRLAVTTRATGYKGSVTVYDAQLAPALQLNLSSSFVTDALVSADNKTLAAITMGQGTGSFESALSLYALSRTEEDTAPDATCPLGSGVVLDLGECAAGYWALSDASLSLVDHAGSLAGSYDYNGRYLKEFSLGGDSFAALLLGKYRAGTVSDLVVVDSTGAASATLSVNEQVLSLSASGRYLAVLTADRLDLYTADLTPYATLEGTQGARKVLMREDGTALLVGSNTARLYIPD